MSSPPNAEYIVKECAWCRANPGNDPLYQDRLCKSCSGQGHVQVAAPGITCLSCGGSGKQPNQSRPRCDACAGTGWALRWIPPPQ
jgi:DnaJ-class molecular chaperone